MISVIPARAGIQENRARNWMPAREHDGYSWLYRGSHAEMEKAINHGEHGGHGEKRELRAFRADQPLGENILLDTFSFFTVIAVLRCSFPGSSICGCPD
jgi:hypothetical protein